MISISSYPFWNKDLYFPNESLVVKIEGINDLYDDLSIYDYALVDVDIAELILLFNLKGLYTHASCSGILKNHKNKNHEAYISFHQPLPNTLIERILKLGNFGIDSDIVIRPQFRWMNDDERIAKWKELYDLLDNWCVHKELLFKYLKNQVLEDLEGWDSKTIARETKIANKLLRIKKKEFWRAFELGFKLNSLAFLLSPEGKSRIIKFDNQLKLNKSMNDEKLV